MSTGHGGSGASDLLWEDAGVCMCACVCTRECDRIQLFGKWTDQSQAGGFLARTRRDCFQGERKCLAGGSLRPTGSQEIGKPNASGQGPLG